MLRRIGLSSCLAVSSASASPGVPIDRIVLVLQQVGAGFAGEAVRHAASRVLRGGRPPRDQRCAAVNCRRRAMVTTPDSYNA